MDDLLDPWFIVGGYAIAFVLMQLAGWWEKRGTVASAVCYALCGTVVSETSLYWLSAGTGSSVPQLVWIAFPLVFTAFVAWRGWRQQTWIRWLDPVEEPTFGVLPHNGHAVRLGHPDLLPPRRTVEFGHQGHQLLGVEYSTSPPGRSGGAVKLAEQIDSIYAMVELRTPVVPTLVIRPNTKAFEPEHFTPLEDARITRNYFGWLDPVAPKRESIEINAEFDRRFSVSTDDPEFAAAVLTIEVRALILNDPWFRVRPVAFGGDAMWTIESGGLTEDRMFGNSRRLAILAAAVPAPVWEVWGDPAFSSVAAGSDTSYTGWNGKRGGVVRTPVNRRREAADRQPVTSVSLTMRSLIALGLLVGGLLPIGNSVAAMTGLATETHLVVTATYVGTSCPVSDNGCQNSSDRVHGTYELGGTTHEVTTQWYGSLPKRGDVVDIAVGPLWWRPVLESNRASVITLLYGLIPLVLGGGLAKATYRPRPPRRIRKLRKEKAARV
ncbi:hypothetical protein [Amycolatopsis sp. NBC_01480]|uniref:hypothetical protein n=1 Tax=Amycolatopsis sp. NBC_01480 TaxID=2903562 RepID=UPI002E2B0F93|nr:hypothetical protein [Amycolatopsis sp. NBC_01480]